MLDVDRPSGDIAPMASPPILTLDDISLTFGGDPLFDTVALAVHPGDRIGLVGRNGSGKSTLMKIIAGLVEPDRGTRFLRPGCAIAYMEQDPDMSAYPSLDAFVSDGIDPDGAHRVERAMHVVKLRPGIATRDASGGERRRAALARILTTEADLLLLDEPTNHLDIEAIGWLESHLRAAKQAFVMISHDRAMLRNLTRATLWVDRANVRRLDKGFEHFEAWRDKAFEEEDLARHKLDRKIKAEGRWAVEGISARRKRNMGRVRRLQDMRAARAARIKRPGTANMAFDNSKSSGRLVVEATAISKKFGDIVLVDDFSLRVMRGERVALVGPNGAGKTTLLNLLTGVVAPDSGTVKPGSGLLPAVFDQNREQIPAGVSLWDALTQYSVLGVSGRNDQIMVHGRPRHVIGYLKDFLFSEAQARGPVSALSGGEKARLLLARIMARESNLLILDEPTNDLDIETLDLLQELIETYDGTVLLVSHDRDFLDRVATTTIAFEGNGSWTVYAGGYSDILAQRGGAGKPPDAVPGAGKPKAARARKAGAARKLSFRQEHRLNELPGEMEKLGKDISRLEALLGDTGLFTRDPDKFQKASAALGKRRAALEQAEEEWLELAAAREALALPLD